MKRKNSKQKKMIFFSCENLEIIKKQPKGRAHKTMVIFSSTTTTLTTQTPSKKNHPTHIQQQQQASYLFNKVFF